MKFWWNAGSPVTQYTWVYHITDQQWVVMSISPSSYRDWWKSLDIFSAGRWWIDGEDVGLYVCLWSSADSSASQPFWCQKVIIYRNLSIVKNKQFSPFLSPTHPLHVVPQTPSMVHWFSTWSLNAQHPVPSWFSIHSPRKCIRLKCVASGSVSRLTWEVSVWQSSRSSITW